jgi:hypothetical protein
MAKIEPGQVIAGLCRSGAGAASSKSGLRASRLCQEPARSTELEWPRKKNAPSDS